MSLGQDGRRLVGCCDAGGTSSGFGCCAAGGAHRRLWWSRWPYGQRRLRLSLWWRGWLWQWPSQLQCRQLGCGSGGSRAVAVPSGVAVAVAVAVPLAQAVAVAVAVPLGGTPWPPRWQYRPSPAVVVAARCGQVLDVSVPVLVPLGHRTTWAIRRRRWYPLMETPSRRFTGRQTTSTSATCECYHVV